MHKMTNDNLKNDKGNLRFRALEIVRVINSRDVDFIFRGQTASNLISLLTTPASLVCVCQQRMPNAPAAQLHRKVTKKHTNSAR